MSTETFRPKEVLDRDEIGMLFNVKTTRQQQTTTISAARGELGKGPTANSPEKMRRKLFRARRRDRGESLE